MTEEIKNNIELKKIQKYGKENYDIFQASQKKHVEHVMSIIVNGGDENTIYIEDCQSCGVLTENDGKCDKCENDPNLVSMNIEDIL